MTAAAKCSADAGERPAVASVEIYQSLSAPDRMVFLDNYYAVFRLVPGGEPPPVTHRVRAPSDERDRQSATHRQYVMEGDPIDLASPPECRRRDGHQSV